MFEGTFFAWRGPHEIHMAINILNYAENNITVTSYADMYSQEKNRT